MYFYFSSDYPSALKLNGGYLGVIQNNIKTCELDLHSPTLIEVCPLIQGESPITFVLDDSFNGEIIGASVTDLKGGYLIKFCRTYRGGEFCVLAQERFNDFGVTVFSDNGLKISIESQSDFFADNVFYACDCAEIKTLSIDGEKICAVILRGQKNLLFVYTVGGKINKVLEKAVDEFSFDNGLATTETFFDMAKHKITCEWTFKNGKLIEKNRTVNCGKQLSLENLPSKLVPFAFLEELLAGGDILPYLDGGVKENADKLYGFFGEFLGVMPPPVFREIEQVGLIYKKTENSYFVEYFTFELLNKKICNIKKLD